MTQSVDLTRRMALVGGSVLVWHSAVPAWPQDESGVTHWLSADSATAIADAVRRDEKLVSQILPLSRVTIRALTELERTGLRIKIQNDFASGRTHVVEGWLLSRTEIELCMLEHGLFS